MGDKGKKLLVTGLDFLMELCSQYIKSAEVVCTSDVSEENLSKEVEDADGILYMQAFNYPLTRKVIESAKRLKFIQSSGAGYDLIDVGAATKKRVVVMNMPTATTQSVAEHAIALILACAKNLVKSHESVLEGKWRTMELGMGVELWKKKLGIIGFGRIGREVGKRMRSFEMDLVVYDPYVKQGDIEKTGGKKVDLKTLLAESDIITIHSPLTRETRGLIGEKEFGLMKDSVILVNTARGELVDEKALVKALSEGRIKTAGLDVYEKEPVEKGNPLFSLENVILTPHSATQTTDALMRFLKQNGEQVEKALNGVFQNVINPEVLKGN